MNLGAFPEDIYIIKPMNSSFHNMFYAKNLEDVSDLIKFVVAGNKEPVDPKTGLQLFFQVGRPHYDACVKHYFVCGTSFFNFQETLNEDYFDKTKGPQFGEIDRRLAYNQLSENLDKIVPFLKVKKFMLQVSKAANYEGIGLDYVVSKRDHSINIIDFNSYPGYKVVKKPQMKHVHERYLNELFLNLKSQHFAEFQKDGQFTSGQVFTISTHHISIQHGFINRSFAAQGASESVESGQYTIAQVGGENHAADERIKGFTQEFFGRVIQLEKVGGSGDDTVFILTKPTADKISSGINYIAMEFDQFFNMFDLVKVGYNATINV